jgi:hypothetical protein
MRWFSECSVDLLHYKYYLPISGSPFQEVIKLEKLSLAVAIMMLLASLASAHNGLLGLYTDETATDCDREPILFAPFDVHLIYVRSDGGPDGITAFEFKIEKHDANIIICSATWKQGFISLGDVESGISVATEGCYGAGQSCVSLGYMTLFSVVSPLPWDAYLKVVADPCALEPGIWVSMCEPGYPLHEVLGGYFQFEEGVCPCPHAVETMSWGAIKSIIRQ